MRGSPFLMPVDGAGVVVWWWRGRMRRSAVRIGAWGSDGCIAAGWVRCPWSWRVVALCVKRGGGCRCVGVCCELVCGVRVRLRGAVAVQRRGRVCCPWCWRPVACAGSGAVGAGMRGYCEAAGVVMGVAGAWLGGAAGCVTECADLCIGTRGRNIERQGRGKQRETLRSGINARNATQRIGKGAENSCLWKSGKMLENLDFH